MSSAPTSEGTTPTYRSGTAARLAGIPVETLRMWERRYGVVGPQTSASGHRRYSAAEVGRLALIKELVDLGHPIGTVAQLPAARLNELRAAQGAPRPSRSRRANAGAIVRVAIVGAALAARATSAAARFPRLQIVATCNDQDHAIESLRGTAADVLAIELSTMRDETIELVGALTATVGARYAICSHRFGSDTAVRELRRRGHIVARAPIDLADIEALGIGLPGAHEAPVASSVAAARFDEPTLAQLAQLVTSVGCECPRHVVDLLMSLGAFERYSDACAASNPADAALHRKLGHFAGAARTLFEEALILVAEAEGVPLPTTDA